MSPTRAWHGTLFTLALVMACTKSQAYQIGPEHPPADGGTTAHVIEVVEDLPPFTFEPDVVEVHRAIRPQPASFSALPTMVQSNRCINAGAIAEGKARVAKARVGSKWAPGKAGERSKAKAKPRPKKTPAPGATSATQKAATAAPTDTAPAAEPAADMDSEMAEAPPPMSGGGDFGDDAMMGEAEDGAPASPAIVAHKRERKQLSRDAKKADRRAGREQRRFDRANNRARRKGRTDAIAPSAPPHATAMRPQEEIVSIPAEMPPAAEGWGRPIYVSNDDSMSLSSAQRVAFAVEQFQPLAPNDVRPHELLNWAFGSLDAETDASHDFAVEGDVLSRSADGTHTMALAVHGRRVGRAGRRHAALTLVVDQSGSMKREGRMDFVRRGLLRMVRELKRGDIINLVTFDNKVCPRLTNFVVGRDSAEVLNREILRIKPRGATNLHAGLKQGYALADATYQPRYSNRVMVITDALANRGVTDARTMGMVSDFYDARRIRLSGIGVGKQFNDDLLDRLTEKGRGAYVFLGSEQVVDQVFGTRFVSLIETIANDVHFRLHLPPTMRVQRFHGEEASTQKRDVQAVHFFADTSQVLLVDVEAWKGQLRGEDDVMLEIEYQNPETGDLRVEQHVIHLAEAIDSGHGYAANGQLVLAFANGLKELARRAPPRGFEPRPGGWPDAGGLQQCREIRQEMLAISDAPWQRSAVDVWDRFCSRYDARAARRPGRKR